MKSGGACALSHPGETENPFPILLRQDDINRFEELPPGIFADIPELEWNFV